MLAALLAGGGQLGLVAVPLRQTVRHSARVSNLQLKLIGGEWGGWCCSFSPTSGVVERIPESFCTSDMIEYDTIPRGWEELCTEDGTSRRTVRLLPAGEG